jgi:hypothetical protein
MPPSLFCGLATGAVVAMVMASSHTEATHPDRLCDREAHHISKTAQCSLSQLLGLLNLMVDSYARLPRAYDKMNTESA